MVRLERDPLERIREGEIGRCVVDGFPPAINNTSTSP
jgi:hypothetical protein